MNGRAPRGRSDSRADLLVTRPGQSRVIHLLLLAVPFLAAIAWTRGLTEPFAGIQAGDESLHWEVVRAVAGRWPAPAVSGYGTWSGPLVYWLLATLSLPLGGSLVAARLVVAGFSWGTCALAYVVFRDRLGARAVDALVLALLLAVSPFFFGQAFRVLTDNPTWFFVVLALERLLAYTSRPAQTRFLAFAVCVAAATLMRHISVWLLLPGVVALLSVPVPRRRLSTSLALLVLSVAPLAALLVYWGGPLPPAPAGLPAEVPVEAGHRVRNLLLSVGVAGWYALFLLPSAEITAWWRRAGEDRRWAFAIGLPALAALAAAAAGALGTVTAYLGLVSRLPQPLVRGSGLLWWALVPLGAAAVSGLVVTRRTGARDRVLVAALLGVLLSAAANPRWYQRYVDVPLLLLFAGLAVAAVAGLTRLDRERWVLAFVVAAGAYVSLLV